MVANLSRFVWWHPNIFPLLLLLTIYFIKGVESENPFHTHNFVFFHTFYYWLALSFFWWCCKLWDTPLTTFISHNYSLLQLSLSLSKTWGSSGLIKIVQCVGETRPHYWSNYVLVRCKTKHNKTIRWLSSSLFRIKTQIKYDSL